VITELLFLHHPPSLTGEDSPFYKYGDHEILVSIDEVPFDDKYTCEIGCCVCGCVVQCTERGISGQDTRVLTLPAMDEFMERIPSSCVDAADYAEVCMIMTE